MNRPQKDPKERRGSKRFPFEWDVRYTAYLNGRELLAGRGRTVNIGSGGVLFEAEKPLMQGLTVKLLMDWPVMLEGGVPLQLELDGRILRGDHRRIAIVITRFEYRTRRSAMVPERRPEAWMYA